MQPLHTSAPVTPKEPVPIVTHELHDGIRLCIQNLGAFQGYIRQKKDTICVCLLCSMEKGLPRTSPVRPLGGTAPTLPDPRGAQVLETLHGTNLHPLASSENGNVHSCWSRVSMDCQKKISPFANHQSLNSIVTMPQKAILLCTKASGKGIGECKMSKCMNVFLPKFTSALQQQ